MKKQNIYVRHYEPSATQRTVNGVWKIIILLALLLCIESLFFTIPLGYHAFIAGRKQRHVHINSHPH